MASAARKRLTWLSSAMGPDSHFPEGTMTRPPPAAEQAVMAFRKASVFSVCPSGIAPKSAMLKSLSGKVGSTGAIVGNGQCSIYQGMSLAASWAEAGCVETRDKATRIVGLAVIFRYSCEHQITSADRGPKK